MKMADQRLVLLPITLLLIIGIHQRVQPEQRTPTLYYEGLTEKLLIEFLLDHHLNAPKQVYYSRDRGIRGLQTKLDECEGYLQLSVLPEGDEAVSLWERRARQAGYRTYYLYRTDLHTEFPLFRFWFETNLAVIRHKLSLHTNTLHESVIALAAPERCQIDTSIPWEQFKL